MNKDDDLPPKLIVIDDRDDIARSPLLFAAMLARIGAAEHVALARIHDAPPRLPTRAELEALQPKAEKGVHPDYAKRPARQRGKNLLEMMIGLGALDESDLVKTIKAKWETPTIEQRNLCDNCDGAPDGGHVGDAWCLQTLEDL